MKDLMITQKRYDQLSGVGGGLLLVAIRVIAGAIMSFINAFLVHSYISWGFAYWDVYPLIYLGLGFVYCLTAALLFTKNRRSS